MQQSRRRFLALAALLLAGGAGCGGSTITDPPQADPGVTVGGLNFVVFGSGYSTGAGALPTPDPTVAPPVVTLTGSLVNFASAQLAVSAAEPFQTVLILPVGAPSYARVAMPGDATLIGITTKREVLSSFIAQQVLVAIVRGGKVSAPVTISLSTPVN
ncbi:MAG: hypothetical protein IT355_20070 [Gemmatimonadaceae bacterium]|nr:hypothetical protein [Gemmatimonadaceae bacterium]